MAGKIVSVEARHAAWVRDIIDNGSFANQEVVDSDGLDIAKSPSVVLSAAFSHRISPRREAIKNLASMGKKVTLAALPFFIAELFKKAYGASAPTDVNGVLLEWISIRYLAR